MIAINETDDQFSLQMILLKVKKFLALNWPCQAPRPPIPNPLNLFKAKPFSKSYNSASQMLPTFVEFLLQSQLPEGVKIINAC